MSKELKEHGYFKEKGVVEKLVSKYIGQIAMLKSGDLLQVSSFLCRPVPGILQRSALCSVLAGQRAHSCNFFDLETRNACRWTRLS